MMMKRRMAQSAWRISSLRQALGSLRHVFFLFSSLCSQQVGAVILSPI
jgi:hypothetical protein